MTWFAANAVWLAPACVGVAVFLVVLALYWPSSHAAHRRVG